LYMMTKQLTTFVILTALLAGCTVPVEQDNASLEQIRSLVLVDKQQSLALKPKRQVADSFLTAWPKEFTRTEQYDSALAKFHKYYDGELGQPEFNLFIQPPTSPEDIEWVEHVVVTVLGPYAEVLPRKINVIVGWETEFMVQTVKEHGLDLPAISDVEPCDLPYGACSMGNTVWIGTGEPLSNMSDRIDFTRMFAHKTFHSVQDIMDPAAGGQIPGRFSANFRPVWWTEGTAEFTGFAVADLIGVADYVVRQDDNQTFRYFTRQTRPPLEMVHLEEWESSRVSELDYMGPPPHYLFGQVATEHIVASLGYQAIVDIYIKLNEGSSFKNAFESVTGLTLQEFYQHMDGSGVLLFFGHTY
jgi:hypothetical protein